MSVVRKSCISKWENRLKGDKINTPNFYFRGKDIRNFIAVEIAFQVLCICHVILVFYKNNQKIDLTL